MSRAREQEVHRYLAALSALPDLSHEVSDDPDGDFPPAGYIPRSALDTSLTAFAQLATLRLNVSRALISLIDSERQYVLAEATQTLSLQEDSRHEDTDELWLGTAIIPRGRGMCQHVLSLQPEDAEDRESANAPDILVVNDLQEDDGFRRHLMQSQRSSRFYAGIPIYSSKQQKIGVYCVFGHEPRPGLTSTEQQFLRDMSRTVTDYMGLCMIRQDHSRKEQMLRGLGSFVDGSSTMDEFRLADVASGIATERKRGQEVELTDDEKAESDPSQPAAASAAASDAVEKLQPHSSTVLGSDRENAVDKQTTASTSTPRTGHTSSSRSRDYAFEVSSDGTPLGGSYQDTLQPKGANHLFSRAAQTLREAADLSGVVFFDASLALQSRGATSRRDQSKHSLGRTQEPGSTEPRSHTPERESKDSSLSVSESESVLSSESDHQEATDRLCPVLGRSIVEQASIDGSAKPQIEPSITEKEMRSILRRNPNGRIFHLDPAGNVTGSEGSSADEALLRHLARHRSDQSSPRMRPNASKTVLPSMSQIAPGAHSLAVMPLWHYEQDRWSALAICWTTRDSRVLSARSDLLLFRIFGDSILNGIARLEAIISNEAKTTFLSSISHELRSPLHGILGSSEFLMDTSLDGFQSDMLCSIEQCGRTLLDTVDNLLDFAKINDFSQPYSKSIKSNKRHRHVRGNSNKLASSIPRRVRNVDLVIATEEAVEAVFAGQSLRILEQGWEAAEEHVASNQVHAQDGQDGMDRIKIIDRKRVRVVLDLPQNDSWIVKLQPGAWRRILMSLVGNALKYTETGFVSISLQLEISPTNPEYFKIKLTVLDSGRGISKQFLQTKLFTPFAQEDPFSSGPGLGLSIVRQLVDTMSGRIEIKSERGIGTQARVTMTVPKGEDDSYSSSHMRRETFSSVTDRLRQKKVCVLNKPLPPDEFRSSSPNGEVRYGAAIAAILKEWLKIDVIYAETWKPEMAHIVFCPEPSFENLALMQEADSVESVPQVIFVCLDAIEAASIRGDARVTGSIKPVEIITQPCGPYKLAAVLDRCLKGLEKIDAEGIESVLPTSEHDNGKAVRSEPVQDDSKRKTLHAVVEPPPVDSPSSVSPIPRDSDIVKISDDGAHPSILIVDDNPINLKLLSTFLKKQLLPYLSAVNGLEAVERYKAAPVNSIRYILMDLSMPVLDGMSATREIRQHEKENSAESAKVIALTGLVSATTQIEARNAGIDHYMTKPVRFNELKDILALSKGD